MTESSDADDLLNHREQSKHASDRSSSSGGAKTVAGARSPPFWYNSTIALNIKDSETERLAAEVAALAGETKTRAVRVALEQRKEQLLLRRAPAHRGANLRRFLEDEAWPQIPKDVLGTPLSRKDRQAILGYGPAGV